jgi:hypothetical protein
VKEIIIEDKYEKEREGGRKRSEERAGEREAPHRFAMARSR